MKLLVDESGTSLNTIYEKEYDCEDVAGIECRRMVDSL
jgi:hypothetical protein